jgi:hypothetical protein
VSSVAYCLTIPSAIFTTALNDQVVFYHPCHGVSAPTAAKKIRTIITPEDFQAPRRADQGGVAAPVGDRHRDRAPLGRVDRASPEGPGLCGVHDLPVVVELTSKFHPDGGHFLVKEYPKDKEHRQVSISPEPDTRLRDYIKRRVLGPDDLIFRLDAADVGGLRELVPAPTPEEKKEFEFVSRMARPRRTGTAP